MRKGQPVSNHHSQKSKGEVRIITGQWRGRKLPVLNSQGLRPTTDRIKETLFNWLMPYIAGARCYLGSTAACGSERSRCRKKPAGVLSSSTGSLTSGRYGDIWQNWGTKKLACHRLFAQKNDMSYS